MGENLSATVSHSYGVREVHLRGLGVGMLIPVGRRATVSHSYEMREVHLRGL